MATLTHETAVHPVNLRNGANDVLELCISAPAPVFHHTLELSPLRPCLVGSQRANRIAACLDF
jgi:hypothetical protein